MGTIDRIRNVARRLVDTQRDGNQVIAVISAMSGVTDQLIGLAHQVMDTPPERELDMLVSTGEQQSVALLCMAIADMGGKAISLPGLRQVSAPTVPTPEAALDPSRRKKFSMLLKRTKSSCALVSRV